MARKQKPGVSFDPAPTKRAPQVIYDQIYQKIISGELKPGDRLPAERELAEQFQRSRPSVREALRMLQQEGLLEIAVGSAGGPIVRGISMKSVEKPLKKLVDVGAINLDELVEYRQLNDRACARMAAMHRTDEDVAKLRRIMDEYWDSIQDTPRLRAADLKFHDALAQASHNSLAILINDVVVTLNTNMYWDAVREMPPEKLEEVNQEAFRSHQGILDAVAAQDPDRAGRCVDWTVELYWKAILQ